MGSNLAASFLLLDSKLVDSEESANEGTPDVDDVSEEAKAAL